MQTVSSYRGEGGGAPSVPWLQTDDDEAVRCMQVLLETCLGAANVPDGNDRTPLHFTATLPALYGLTLIGAGGM